MMIHRKEGNWRRWRICCLDRTDFKKEYKEFYMPKNKPAIVTVPRMNYIAVRGSGDQASNQGKGGMRIWSISG